MTEVFGTIWRSIETAPRDGTRILAFGGGLGEVVEVVSYNERVGCWNAPNDTLDDTDYESDGYIRPTHWMPLPGGPVTNCACVRGGFPVGSCVKCDAPQYADVVGGAKHP